jgi:hypothetical protein
MDAWKNLLGASVSSGHLSTFQYDLQGVTLQVLSNIALELHKQAVFHFNVTKNVTALLQIQNQFIELTLDAEELLNTQLGTLLGMWMYDASSWATDSVSILIMRCYVDSLSTVRTKLV